MILCQAPVTVPKGGELRTVFNATESTNRSVQVPNMRHWKICPWLIRKRSPRRERLMKVRCVCALLIQVGFCLV